MTPAGRPFGSKSRKPRKDIRIMICLSPEENAIIEKARGDVIKSVWVRRVALRFAEDWKK